MSMLFGKTKTIRKTKNTRTREGKAATHYGGKTIKYWELYGTLAALGAGLSKNIVAETVPDGHCAELYAIGFKPDSGTGTKETLDLEIGYDVSKLTGIKFPVLNYSGLCALPWGDDLNPPLQLDYPMRRGNLTVKYNEGQEIDLSLTAYTAGISNAVYARAKILLYEPADVARIFGVNISNFATLPGGVSQSLPYRVFADYGLNPVSLGKAKWVELYSKKVQDYEEIRLNHLGWKPFGALTGLNFDALRLYCYRNKKEFPEYEPYWKINPDYNMLPIGGDKTTVPIQKIPSVIASYVWTNTTLYAYFKDVGTAVAADDGVLQLLGTYRRIR